MAPVSCWWVINPALGVVSRCPSPASEQGAEQVPVPSGEVLPVTRGHSPSCPLGGTGVSSARMRTLSPEAGAAESRAEHRAQGCVCAPKLAMRLNSPCFTPRGRHILQPPSPRRPGDRKGVAGRLTGFNPKQTAPMMDVFAHICTQTQAHAGAGTWLPGCSDLVTTTDLKSRYSVPKLRRRKLRSEGLSDSDPIQPVRWCRPL